MQRLPTITSLRGQVPTNPPRNQNLRTRTRIPLMVCMSKCRNPSIRPPAPLTSSFNSLHNPARICCPTLLSPYRLTYIGDRSIVSLPQCSSLSNSSLTRSSPARICSVQTSDELLRFSNCQEAYLSQTRRLIY